MLVDSAQIEICEEGQVNHGSPINNDDHSKSPCNLIEEEEESEEISYVETCERLEDKKSLLRPPSTQRIQRLPDSALVCASMQHVLWIALSALPTIIIVCTVGFLYSRLPWTRKGSGTGTNHYFDRWTLFWFDDIGRTLMITVLNVIVACVLFNLSALRTLRFVITIALPITLCATLAFYGILKWYTANPFAVWFYYIDIGIFMTTFFIVVPFAQLEASKVVGASRLHVTKFYILPMVVMALGIAFVDIYFSKTYRVEKDGSLLKYSQRLIVYPLLMDGFLGLGEFFIRKLEGTTVRGEAHSIYLIQVRFGILGRYMNLTAGNLKMLTITCALVMIKDVIFHRMGRIQCWLFYKTRRFLKRQDGSVHEFHLWYFEERFRNFRACVLNNDLLHDFTATLVTPVLLVFFLPHRLLYRFDDNLFVLNGKLESVSFMVQFLIQIVFLLTTYVFIVFIEARFNGVDLRYAIARRNALQEFSQVVIYLWGMLQILSAVRVVPNFFQCDSPDICSCHFNINKTEYGCY